MPVGLFFGRTFFACAAGDEDLRDDDAGGLMTPLRSDGIFLLLILRRLETPGPKAAPPAVK
jgi:hypothetical protein